MEYPEVDKAFITAWTQELIYNYNVLCGAKQGTPFNPGYLLEQMLIAAGVKIKEK